MEMGGVAHTPPRHSICREADRTIRAVLARWKALSRTWKIVSIALGLIVLFVVAFWVSLPDVRPLATEIPKTTTMIDLRRQQAAERGKRFTLRWEWRPLTRISAYL